ncbi:glycosyltransferase family 4 protein [Paenibacillus planticolens]|uniref:Glycosyltransferase n=1 Tax=Paenibacillus planticolens TaxID=2654976 RepID=A0ABX1ZW39_9BACL|nr:glycosyltransferase family 4 protein [Paenibacillus planticolens]NOV04272.1 glycosyltransferase [Paenibacillus planticolens]
MKIAFICTEKLTVPPIRGGAIQILINGVTPHIGSRHDLTIFCITDRELPDREVVGGVKYIRVPPEDYVNGVAKELAKLHAGNKKYDVIHVFNRPKTVPAYKAAMPNSRFVVSCHNEMFKDGKISMETGNSVIRTVDRIMSISNYIGQTITTRFPSAKGKVKTVYSGIHLQHYKPIWTPEAQAVRKELRKKFGLENKKVVLFVGRLSKNKGPDVLIKAVEQISKTHKDVVLVIIGSKWFHNEQLDEYGASLRRLAKALGERVVFTGFVPPSEIPAHYLLGDIFVCSSQWQEPLARVHFEAMGAGLPIITTNRGGNAEIIKQNANGMVIEDYSNPGAFVKAITFMLNNPGEALRLGKAARAAVEGNFGFEHVAKRLESLYAPENKK